MAIKDAEDQATYCLECMRKHLDTAYINLEEVEQRLLYNPKATLKVRTKVEGIIADLEAAEKHALDTRNTNLKEKKVLGTLTNALRMTRKYLESTKLGYRDRRIKPVGGIADIQLARELIDRHQGHVHWAIGEIGCGDCDTAEAQMSLIMMRKNLKKELDKPIDLPVEISGEDIQAKATYDFSKGVTTIAVIDEDPEKIETIIESVPALPRKVIVEEHPETDITTIKLEGTEGATVIAEIPRGFKQPTKTLMQEKLEMAALKCKKEPEPMVCATQEALDIQDFKKQRGDPIIPTTAQLIEQITLKMKK